MYIYKQKRAFTLIELLVVIAIVGVLASVVLSAVNSARAKAKESKNLQTIASFGSDITSTSYENITGPACNQMTSTYLGESFRNESSSGGSIDSSILFNESSPDLDKLNKKYFSLQKSIWPYDTSFICFSSLQKTEKWVILAQFYENGFTSQIGHACIDSSGVRHSSKNEPIGFNRDSVLFLYDFSCSEFKNIQPENPLFTLSTVREYMTANNIEPAGSTQLNQKLKDYFVVQVGENSTRFTVGQGGKVSEFEHVFNAMRTSLGDSTGVTDTTVLQPLQDFIAERPDLTTAQILQIVQTLQIVAQVNDITTQTFNPYSNSVSDSTYQSTTSTFWDYTSSALN